MLIIRSWTAYIIVYDGYYTEDCELDVNDPIFLTKTRPPV